MKNKLKAMAKMIISEFFAHFWINVAVIVGVFGNFGLMVMLFVFAFYDRLCKIEKAMACSPKSVTVNIDHGSDEVAMCRELGVKA